MRNRVEILRAIEYTKEDLKNISNLDEIDSFDDKDKEFMEEFKKIYEFGLNQLELFIDKLDNEGKDLDVYSIKYYVNLLLNGPLGTYARKLAEGKKYFGKVPDSLGLMGNKGRSLQNTTVVEGYEYSLGCPVDVFNKLPLFIQDVSTLSIEQTEKFFRSNIHSSVVNDNTRPIVDKDNSRRYELEHTGELAFLPAANYLLKDSYFYQVLDNISEDIFALIKEYLGEENFRLFKDNKEYNAFGDKNDNTSKNWVVKTKIKKEEFDLDLYGVVFDSEEARNVNLKIETAESNKEYNLGTLKGQLGI